LLPNAYTAEQKGAMKVYVQVDLRSAEANKEILKGAERITSAINDRVDTAISKHRIRVLIIEEMLQSGTEHELLAGKRKKQILTISPKQTVMTPQTKKDVVDIMVDLDTMRWEAKGLINVAGRPHTTPMSRESFRNRRRGVWNTAANTVEAKMNPMRHSPLSPLDTTGELYPASEVPHREQVIQSEGDDIMDFVMELNFDAASRAESSNFSNQSYRSSNLNHSLANPCSLCKASNEGIEITHCDAIDCSNTICTPCLLVQLARTTLPEVFVFYCYVCDPKLAKWRSSKVYGLSIINFFYLLDLSVW
jgi:hypothetical protein